MVSLANMLHDYGIFVSAMARLRDISDEFDGSRRFSEEMKNRLALVERDGRTSERVRDTLLPNIAGWTDDPVLGKDSCQKQSVFFYRENDGKGELKAYYTSDWQLGPLE